jgi:carbamoyltransferase
MLLVAPVVESRRVTQDDTTNRAHGLEQVNTKRSDVPAITHVDFSARVQTVDAERHGRYHRLIKSFETQTGCPVIINTSFNVRGEPIVGTPEQAYRCFMATGMDLLVIENFVLHKDRQPQSEAHRTDDYLAQYALD